MIIQDLLRCKVVYRTGFVWKVHNPFCSWCFWVASVLKLSRSDSGCLLWFSPSSVKLILRFHFTLSWIQSEYIGMYYFNGGNGKRETFCSLLKKQTKQIEFHVLFDVRLTTACHSWDTPVHILVPKINEFVQKRVQKHILIYFYILLQQQSLFLLGGVHGSNDTIVFYHKPMFRKSI